MRSEAVRVFSSELCYILQAPTDGKRPLVIPRSILGSTLDEPGPGERLVVCARVGGGGLQLWLGST